jgi:sugar/nucleoside kinase (ribokinase family)
MNGRRGVVTAGTWCVDLNKTIARWPAEDTLNRYLSLDRRGGGSGCNMAIDLKRLDPAMPVSTMGVVGDDDGGRFLWSECDAFGVERQKLVARSGVATPFTDCFNSLDSGRRTHFFFPGASDALTPDDFDFADSSARLLHLGLPGVHAKMDGPWGGESTGWAATLKKARAAGLTTNLEMASAPFDELRAFGRSCAPHLDLMIVNDYEIGGFAGVETREAGLSGRAVGAKVEAALRAALDLGPMRLVVAHFPEGAIALTRDGGRAALGSVAIPSDRIAGVNGAGDAFAAGTLYGWHEGWGLEACVRLGHACAAASMREVSTTAGVGTVAECLELAEKWGLRPPPA